MGNIILEKGCSMLAKYRPKLFFKSLSVIVVMFTINFSQLDVYEIITFVVFLSACLINLVFILVTPAAKNTEQYPIPKLRSSANNLQLQASNN